MPATTLTDRTLIRLSGEDVRGFLQGLVTNDTGGALPVWAALLTPQGKALFDFVVWADGADLLLDCERDQVDALIRPLGLYRLRRPIAIVRDETLAVHWSAAGTQGMCGRLFRDRSGLTIGSGGSTCLPRIRWCSRG